MDPIEQTPPEMSLQDLLNDMMSRMVKIEATLGYVIHSLDIKPPQKLNEVGECDQVDGKLEEV